ncbi:MAG TPA: hypothetical protein VGO13_07290 [Solirubrobacterales bacterium]|nr:hypothetical protein [Solirubrobacterales bacterium]
MTGQLYISEVGNSQIGNNRISEFTPWGKFVKAFGWDVAPGVVNEQQEVRLRAASGEFKLKFEGSESADLPFDASGVEVEAALNGLSSIGGAGGSASIEDVAGNPDGTSPYIYVVAFRGSLGGDDLPELEVVNGTTPLGGGVPTSSLRVRTRADGTPGGAGLESCTKESGCKAGLEGSAAGQFGGASAIAVDANGNIYARETDNHRVQKFDSAGRFVAMFGGEVDKTTGGNVCTAVSSDECGIGVTGAGPGQFGPGFSTGIALCPSGALFVADNERIQQFNLAGAYQSELSVPGETVQELACDPLSEDLYVTIEGSATFSKLDSDTGVEVGAKLKGGGGGLAADLAGNLYVAFSPEDKALQYDPTGKALLPSSCCEGELLPPPNPEEPFSLRGLATNRAGGLYVVYGSSGIDNFIRAFGPAPVEFESPPPVSPEISAQFATSVQRDGATVSADINPHFFTDARYFVQYGTGECSKGDCDKATPVAPGALLTPKVSGSPVRSAGIFLEGLSPGTTYHYRFVAQSSGGGPVFGIDPDGEGLGEASSEEGLEAVFTTFPEASPTKACPNEAFRGGAASRLPDCRAYEMVSPVDKNSGDIKALLNTPNYPTNLDLSSADGNRFTYSSYRSFGAPKGAPYTNQYVAARDPQSGWASEAIDVAQGPAAILEINLENPYTAFSADLCKGWLVVAAEPVLGTGATENFSNVYRRDGCGSPSYEALIQVEPTVETKLFHPELQGTSADGTKAILRVQDKLTSDATAGAFQTYYASEGRLNLVCVLPSGAPTTENCSGGTGGDSTFYPELGRLDSVSHAISADGSRVYWTASPLEPGHPGGGGAPGKVFLRLNPGQEQSAINGGACTEAGKACTVKVSESKSKLASRFLGASVDGDKALFEVTEGPAAGSLYKFDFEAGGSTQIAGKVLGVAGASENLSHVYFISEEALGGKGKAGEPNLYLNQEGTNSFIATLSQADVAVAGEQSPDTTTKPVFHVARASADGSHLAFISTARLSSYDNTDVLSPLPCGVEEGFREGVCDAEVYIFEAGATAPKCVSCNPTGARPRGRLAPGSAINRLRYPAAASLPPPTTQLHFPHVLSSDGRRLFFNSFDALLPRDTNGAVDVYEWESAPDREACVQRGAELYVEAAAGCLSLISSGESPEDSEFLDASPTGEDAFFATTSSLLPEDPGLIDVYDARAFGGIPAADSGPAECHGEACQAPAGVPTDPTSSSSFYVGPEDEKAKKKAPHKKHHHKKKKKKQQQKRRRGQR